MSHPLSHPSPAPVPALLRAVLPVILFTASPPPAATAAPPAPPPRAEPSLRDTFRGLFDIGFGTGRLDPARSALVRHHASLLTCENDLKPARLRPSPGAWDWEKADAWLEWAESLGLRPVGHTLVWCYMSPPWLIERVTAGALAKEQALAWQDDHIRRVLRRYHTRITTWDVVNEALSDAPPAASPEHDPLLRRDPWSGLCGPDYIIAAFRAARQAAPRATLLYNDYGLENPAKRARLFRLLALLETAGARPDAIGIQGHYTIESPPAAALEQAIIEIHNAGYPVHITELDISIHPHQPPGANLQPAPAPPAPPATPAAPLTSALQDRLARRYHEIFTVLVRHAGKIQRVSFWNTDDGNSWRNNWPVKGRGDHPLLFDAALRPKPAFDAVLQTARAAPRAN